MPKALAPVGFPALSIPAEATNPAGSYAGQTIYSTASNALLTWNGTAWKAQAASSVQQGDLTSVVVDSASVSAEVNSRYYLASSGQATVTLPSDADTDPYFAYVNLLLNFQGANAQTTFTDLSSKQNVVSPNGGAALSTSTYQYGVSSLSLDGTGDFLTVPYTDQLFGFGTGDFTVEVMVRNSSDTTDRCLISTYGSSSTGWSFSTDASSRPYFNVSGDGANLQFPGALSTNSWDHLEVGRAAGTLYGFLNGSLVATAGNTENITSAVSTLFIGRLGSSFTLFDWPGFFQGVRITKGFCRHTSSFTAPTGLFPSRGSRLLGDQVSVIVANGRTDNRIKPASGETIDDDITSADFLVLDTDNAAVNLTWAGSTKQWRID